MQRNKSCDSRKKTNWKKILKTNQNFFVTLQKKDPSKWAKLHFFGIVCTLPKSDIGIGHFANF